MTGYFDFLCRQVGIEGNCEENSYFRLAEYMMKLPFYCEMPADKNREDEALELRRGYSDAPKGEAKVFEVLVRMALDMYEMSDGLTDNNRPERWFFLMISNLGLSSVDDKSWENWPEDSAEMVKIQLMIWLNREFEYDGNGSPWPLENPKNDQVMVEMWYQMNGYLMEKINEKM